MDLRAIGAAMDAPSISRGEPVTRFADRPPKLVTGRGSVESLGTELADAGIDRALVVCNRSVGTLDAVLSPVVEGIGRRCVGVFDEATGDKRLRTALAAADHARGADAQAIVGVGAGSGLDVATVAAALVGPDAADEAVIDDLVETGRVTVETDPLALVMVPTTLAGAEQSPGAGITAEAPDGSVVSGGVSDPRLRPLAAVYDPELVAHTPESVLRNSTMNGFNKGIETLYSPAAVPVTDATAARGVSLLAQWLPRLDTDDLEALDAILEGVALAQYGTSREGATGLSIIHAIGHGVTATVPVQQGLVHAAVTPAVLEELFAQAPCRRELLASSLGAAGADGIVEAVAQIRDGLGLPTGLGDLEGVERSMLPAIADATANDRLMDNLPPGVSLGREDLIDVLEAAW